PGPRRWPTRSSRTTCGGCGSPPMPRPSPCSTRTSRTKNKDKRARSRSPQTERQARELGEPERQLVREVRPHVPALLERDGNGAITRVQLREIIRRQGLTGVGNDRLGLVLQELRNQDIKTTRSTAR
ncbi:hypothetical protein ACFWJ3_37670, partial [Streptomyces ardesiacus]